MPEANQSEINNVAWRACDTFRGVVDAENYRNYILVMLFWKYVSERDHHDTYLQEYDGDEARVARRLSRERFQLPDGCDFQSLHQQRTAIDIGERINIALASIEEANKAKLEGVFREVDFNSENKLGQTRDRNARLKLILEDFADPRLDLRPSVIGNVYEYLLERFASDAGKKAGEFYTPAAVSRLLARLLDPKKGDTICDPACGSGSLLIQVGRQADERDFALFGQEMNGTTHALCRMNMFLHGMDSFRIEWGDTLRNPRLVDGAHLDKIVATYRAFQTVDKYAYRATPQELADNDFNLNIPRYVDTFEEEEEIDLDEVKAEIAQLETELTAVRAKMQDHLKELGL